MRLLKFAFEIHENNELENVVQTILLETTLLINCQYLESSNEWLNNESNLSTFDLNTSLILITNFI